MKFPVIIVFYASQHCITVFLVLKKYKETLCEIAKSSRHDLDKFKASKTSFGYLITDLTHYRICNASDDGCSNTFTEHLSQ
jgi:hypothetical protein